MPNYCINFLHVIGTREEVDVFLKENNNTLDFNDYIPYPPKWKERDEEFWGIFEKKSAMTQEEFVAKWGSFVDAYNAEGGYMWCLSNWGTKSNVSDVVVHLTTLPSCHYGDDYTYAHIVISFITAWSPSIPVIKKIMQKYENLDFEFEWFERGMAVCGVLRYDNCDSTDGEKVFTETNSEYHGCFGG